MWQRDRNKPQLRDAAGRKRHIKRDGRGMITLCGRAVREGDLKLARFFRELEVLPRDSDRRTEFLAAMCETCVRPHAALNGPPEASVAPVAPE